MDDDVNEVAAHCPVCGAEYRAGFTTCADDGAELVRGPAPASDESDAERPAAQDWWGRPAGHEAVDGPREDAYAEIDDPVAAVSLPWQDAWLAVGKLRSNGIAAAVYPDHQESPIVGSQVFPVAANLEAEIGLGRTRHDVLVSRADVEAARRAIGEELFADEDREDPGADSEEELAPAPEEPGGADVGSEAETRVIVAWVTAGDADLAEQVLVEAGLDVELVHHGRLPKAGEEVSLGLFGRRRALLEWAVVVPASDMDEAAVILEEDIPSEHLELLE